MYCVAPRIRTQERIKKTLRTSFNLYCVYIVYTLPCHSRFIFDRGRTPFIIPCDILSGARPGMCIFNYDKTRYLEYCSFAVFMPHFLDFIVSLAFLQYINGLCFSVELIELT
jgi:hypothetical protein